MERIVEFFVNNAGVVLFLPLWCMLMIFINSAISFVASKKLTFNFSLGVNLFNIIFGILALVYCIHNPNTFLEKNFLWLNSSDLQISLGTLIDNVSVSCLLFFSVLIALIEVYAFGYLKSENNFQKFFIQINFLKFAILGLILSSNAIQTFIFSGLTSVGIYFLANFWSSKKLASDASKKIFLFNFSGDVLLFCAGIALLYFSVIFSPVKNLVLLSYDNLSFTAETLYSMLSENTFVVIVMIFLSGVLIKFAQFPFHGWLAKSEESPAPVGAFVLGVFPVVCGGLIVLRFYPLLLLSKTVLNIIIVLGLISALMFSFSAMSQNNIKKLLAYVASAQLGLALIALGMGGYSAFAFQMFSFCCAMSVLALVSGAVIFALNNECDIKYFGGLRQKMPIFAGAFFVACLSLAGVGFGGFAASEFVFSEAFLNSEKWLAGGVLLFVFMNAFALFRAYFLTFEGEASSDRERVEVPRRMSFSVIVCSVLAFVVGVLGKVVYDFIYFILPDKLHFDMFFTVIVITAVVFALYCAFYLYVSPVRRFMMLKERFLNKKDILYGLSYNAFYFDDLCCWVFDNIILRLFRLLDFIEKYIVSAVAGILPLSTRVISYFVTRSRNGNLQSYILYSVLLISILLAVVVLMYILGSMAEVLS